LPKERPRSEAPLDSAFYDLPQEQDWVDHSAFTSDLFAQRISDATSMVHQQTSNKLIVGLFNGYFLDIAGSCTGHVRFDKVLATPTDHLSQLDSVLYLGQGPFHAAANKHRTLEGCVDCEWKLECIRLLTNTLRLQG